MWKNKKGLVVAFLVVLSLTFVGCGAPQNPETQEPGEMQQEEGMQQEGQDGMEQEGMQQDGQDGMEQEAPATQSE